MLLLEDKIAKAINSLRKLPDDFGIELENDDFMEQWDMESDLRAAGLNACVYNGVSKCAIVMKESDYVIKIPFNGYWEYREFYNDDTEEYEYEDEASFIAFEEANDLGLDDADCDDYCENELAKYELAVDAGFGDFFLETKYYGHHNGKAIYLQKKGVALNEDRTSRTASDKSLKLVRETRDLHFADINWIALLIDRFSLEKVKAFVKFAENNGILDDLHGGNVGFDMNGNPVLIDWAGWRY